MAKVIEEYSSEHEIAPDDEDSDAKKKKRPGRPRGASDAPEVIREADLVSMHESLEARLNARKDYFIRTLQVVVGEEDFRRLKENRFSEATLAAVTSLVEKVMQHMIVPSRELLAAERGRGITVRFIKEGVPYREREVVSFEKVLDLEEALERVESTAALELAQVSPLLRTTQVRLAKNLVASNLSFNRAETERRKQEAREEIQPLEIRIKKGTKIIRDGDLIERKHVLIFQEMKKLTEVTNALEMALGTILLVILMLVVVTRFSAKNIRAFRTHPKDLLLLGLVLFVFLVTTKIWFWIFGAVWERFKLFPLESYYYAIPFAAGAMLIRFVLNSEMSLAFAAAASLLVGMLMENSIGYAIYCLVSSLVAAWAVASAKQRSSLLKAGAITGLCNIALAVGMSLFGGAFWSFQTLFNAIFAFSGGILAAMIVTASAPVIEVVFGYTTDIKLLELANLNHPLLKDLIVQAPGSYHHSIIVGSLVEGAAESIHCNPLLARVMAYYHDIGKVKSPTYFSENLRDTSNPHDKLKASLSATVIKKHVKDGAELARASKLGEPIVDAILQHHGTSLIKFFSQKAKDQEDPEDTVKEEEFRYPGPKPATREVALVLLADSVEAAAKSIQDPSPARLQGLVQNIINRIFVDGQLDDCEITLKDLHQIARAFNRVLSGIYHHRPDYPEPATKEAAERPAKTTDPKMTAAKKEADKKKEEEKKREEDLKRLGM
jgi:putative nucleotidyltransferase with HDIG domain